MAAMPDGAMIPRQRSVEDIDHDLAAHTWMRDQAVDRLRMDDAEREQRWINTLLDERLAADG